MRVRALLAGAIVMTTGIAANAQTATGGRPYPWPSAPWALAQFVPSPGVDLSAQSQYVTVEWQLTPLLYSFAMRPELFPLRTTVAEPFVRMGGSVEWFISPRHTARPGTVAQQWGIRTGLRLWIPVIQRGETLAVSLAVSTLTEFDGMTSVGYEIGGYALFGIVGLRAMYSPRTREGQTLSLQFSVRYF